MPESNGIKRLSCLSCSREEDGVDVVSRDLEVGSESYQKLANRTDVILVTYESVCYYSHPLCLEDSL